MALTCRLRHHIKKIPFARGTSSNRPIKNVTTNITVSHKPKCVAPIQSILTPVFLLRTKFGDCCRVVSNIERLLFNGKKTGVPIFDRLIVEFLVIVGYETKMWHPRQPRIPLNGMGSWTEYQNPGVRDVTKKYKFTYWPWWAAFCFTCTILTLQISRQTIFFKSHSGRSSWMQSWWKSYRKRRNHSIQKEYEWLQWRTIKMPRRCQCRCHQYHSGLVNDRVGIWWHRSHHTHLH